MKSNVIKEVSEKAKFFYDLWHGEGFVLKGGTHRRVITYAVDGDERQMPMMAGTMAGLRRFDLHIWIPDRMSLTIIYEIDFPNPILLWEGASIITSEVLAAELYTFDGGKWEDFEFDFLMAALGEMVVELGG